jgi:hypothetical protein
MSLKSKLEERISELRNAAAEAEAQVWAIRGALQELETVTLPMIDSEQSENVETESDNTSYSIPTGSEPV